VFWDVFWAVLAALFVYDMARRVWTTDEFWQGMGAWHKLKVIGASFAFAAVAVLLIGSIVSLFSPRFHAWFVPLLNKLTVK